MTNNSHERRRFFRIEDTINLYYRVIDEQQLAQLSQVSNDILSTCSLAAALDVFNQEARVIAPRVERSAPEVYEYLKIIDDKIELIAQAIMRQNSDLTDHASRNVNLSATGIAFESEDKLEPGTLLEIKMMLTSCMAVIIAYAKVIYCKPNKDNPEFPYFVGVDYINLKDEDREILIKHVVKRQMEQIRERKQPETKEIFP
jgi:c-di-GMP-binding flagellar brake protein YcgR